MTAKKPSLLKMPYRYDFLIHLFTLILVIFGLVMSTSATMGIAAGNNSVLIKTIIKQLAFAVAGYASLLLMARLFTFERMRKYIFLIVLVMGGLLLFTLAFREVGGARAWIRIPLPGMEATIQPSEFAKIVSILVIATYLGDLKVQKVSTRDLIQTPLTILLVFSFIILILQSDFGSFAVLAVISAVCFLIPQHKALVKPQKWLFLIIIIGIILAVWVMTPAGMNLLHKLNFLDYQVSRFESALNPFADKYNTGFQLVNGLIAMASGSWFGVGFGKSIRKFTNFPAANTDFVLAIVIEELGILGFLVIAIGYGVIIYRLFKYAMKMKSQKGRVILVGVAMYIIVHFIFNVGGVTGLIPLTGVPLLLISAGGSSTMSILLAIGIAQAVISQFRQGKFE